MLHWHEHCACYLEVLNWRKTGLGVIAQHQCVPLLSGSDEKLLSGEPLLLPYLLMHPCGVYQNLLTLACGSKGCGVHAQSAKTVLPKHQGLLRLRPSETLEAEYHPRGVGNGGTRIRWRSLSSLCSPVVTALWTLRGCSGRTWGFWSTCQSPVIAADVEFSIFIFFFFFLVPRTFDIPSTYISLNNAPLLSSILHSCFNNSTMGIGIFTLPLFSFSLYLNDFPSAAYIHFL